MNFDEKERILKSVMDQLEPERTARKKAQVRKLTSVAAIAVAVLLLGACAVKVFHLDEKIAAVIGGSNPQVESVATEISAADDHDGIRIEGRQITSDGKVTYISFDVVSLTDLTFRYDNTFIDNLVVLDDEYLATGRIYSISAVSEDGKTMSLVLELKTEAFIGEHKIRMIVTDLIENFATEEVLAEGTWQIEFDYTGHDLCKEFVFDEVIVVDGIDLYIDKAEISPLTFHLDVSFPEGSEMPPEDWWGIDTFDWVEIMFADGRTQMVTDRGAGWIDEGDRQRGSIEGRPTNFINVDDIIGLSFDGQVVKVK